MVAMFSRGRRTPSCSPRREHERARANVRRAVEHRLRVLPSSDAHLASLPPGSNPYDVKVRARVNVAHVTSGVYRSRPSPCHCTFIGGVRALPPSSVPGDRGKSLHDTLIVESARGRRRAPNSIEERQIASRRGSLPLSSSIRISSFSPVRVSSSVARNRRNARGRGKDRTRSRSPPVAYLPRPCVAARGCSDCPREGSVPNDAKGEGQAVLALDGGLWLAKGASLLRAASVLLHQEQADKQAEWRSQADLWRQAIMLAAMALECAFKAVIVEKEEDLIVGGMLAFKEERPHHVQSLATRAAIDGRDEPNAPHSRLARNMSWPSGRTRHPYKPCISGRPTGRTRRLSSQRAGSFSCVRPNGWPVFSTRRTSRSSAFSPNSPR
jgi:hypothetical protein